MCDWYESLSVFYGQPKKHVLNKQPLSISVQVLLSEVCVMLEIVMYILCQIMILFL